MFKLSANLQVTQRQFQDMKVLLTNIEGALSRTGDPTISAAIQDFTRLNLSLGELEQSVNESLKIKQSQLGALMGVGQAINSSLGRKRVLEEVMDTLIKLVRAERGFLMLRDPEDGELNPEVSRGIDHVDLAEELAQGQWDDRTPGQRIRRAGRDDQRPT